MHFARLIPDWNSLESVRRTHSDLEAAALAFFALLVLFDILAHLSKDENRKTLLEKIGLCFFAVAVVAEIMAYPYGQRNDTLSANMIGSLSTEAEHADTKAKKALTVSGTALAQAGEAATKAGKAEDSLGKAEKEADNAQAASSSALTLARSARQEADSFEEDIAAARKQSAKAEADTAQIKSGIAPRRLDPIQQASIASKLSSFPNESAALTWYPDSFEAGKFAADIEQALTLPQAHWRVTNRPDPAGINDMPIVSGILILTMPTDRSELAGAQLAEALASEKVVVSISPLTAFFPSFGKTFTDRKSQDVYATRVLIVVGNHP